MAFVSWTELYYNSLIAMKLKQAHNIPLCKHSSDSNKFFSQDVRTLECTVTAFFDYVYPSLYNDLLINAQPQSNFRMCILCNVQPQSPFRMYITCNVCNLQPQSSFRICIPCNVQSQSSCSMYIPSNMQPQSNFRMCIPCNVRTQFTHHRRRWRRLFAGRSVSGRHHGVGHL